MLLYVHLLSASFAIPPGALITRHIALISRGSPPRSACPIGQITATPTTPPRYCSESGTTSTASALTGATITP